MLVPPECMCLRACVWAYVWVARFFHWVAGDDGLREFKDWVVRGAGCGNASLLGPQSTGARVGEVGSVWVVQPPPLR